MSVLLKIDQVMEIMGMGESTIHEKLKNGLFLPGVKIGRNRLWNRDDVYAFIVLKSKSGIIPQIAYESLKRIQEIVDKTDEEVN